MKKRVFWDMDGVMTVFKEISSPEEMYEKGFFGNMIPNENAVECAKDLINNHSDEIETFVLSKYLSDSEFALQEKNEWLDKNVPEIDESHRIFVPMDGNKADYVPNGFTENDLIVDDYSNNLILSDPPAISVEFLNGINNHSNVYRHRNAISFEKTPKEMSRAIIDIANGEIVKDEVPHISRISYEMNRFEVGDEITAFGSTIEIIEPQNIGADIYNKKFVGIDKFSKEVVEFGIKDISTFTRNKEVFSYSVFVSFYNEALKLKENSASLSPRERFVLDDYIKAVNYNILNPQIIKSFEVALRYNDFDISNISKLVEDTYHFYVGDIKKLQEYVQRKEARFSDMPLVSLYEHIEDIKNTNNEVIIINNYINTYFNETALFDKVVAVKQVEDGFMLVSVDNFGNEKYFSNEVFKRDSLAEIYFSDLKSKEKYKYDKYVLVQPTIIEQMGIFREKYKAGASLEKLESGINLLNDLSSNKDFDFIPSQEAWSKPYVLTVMKRFETFKDFEYTTRVMLSTSQLNKIEAMVERGFITNTMNKNEIENILTEISATGDIGFSNILSNTSTPQEIYEYFIENMVKEDDTVKNISFNEKIMLSDDISKEEITLLQKEYNNVNMYNQRLEKAKFNYGKVLDMISLAKENNLSIEKIKEMLAYNSGAGLKYSSSVSMQEFIDNNKSLQEPLEIEDEAGKIYFYVVENLGEEINGKKYEKIPSIEEALSIYKKIPIVDGKVNAVIGAAIEEIEVTILQEGRILNVESYDNEIKNNIFLNDARAYLSRSYPYEKDIENELLNKYSKDFELYLDGEKMETTFYVADKEHFNGEDLLLVESTEYGNKYGGMIIDTKGNIILSEVYNGFDEYKEKIKNLVYTDHLDEPIYVKSSVGKIALYDKYELPFDLKFTDKYDNKYEIYLGTIGVSDLKLIFKSENGNYSNSVELDKAFENFEYEISDNFDDYNFEMIGNESQRIFKEENISTNENIKLFQDIADYSKTNFPSKYTYEEIKSSFEKGNVLEVKDIANTLVTLFKVSKNNEVEKQLLNRILGADDLKTLFVEACKGLNGLDVVELLNENQENEIVIDNYKCVIIDKWDNYILGQLIEDNSFYYATVGNQNISFEYDKRPTRQDVENSYIDYMSEKALNNYETEFGADGSRAFPHLNDEEPLLSEYKYYSYARPVSMGTYPKENFVSFENYDNRTFIKEAGRECWGVLIYSKPLDEKTMSNYDLIYGNNEVELNSLSLAKRFNDIVKNIDTYEYNDTVDDENEFIDSVRIDFEDGFTLNAHLSELGMLLEDKDNEEYHNELEELIEDLNLYAKENNLILVEEIRNTEDLLNKYITQDDFLYGKELTDKFKDNLSNAIIQLEKRGFSEKESIMYMATAKARYVNFNIDDLRLDMSFEEIKDFIDGKQGLFDFKKITDVDFVVIDTETTGFEKTDEVVELGILDNSGEILFNDFFSVKTAISDSAKEVNHITEDMLKNKSNILERWDEIYSALKGKTPIIYNKDFDLRLLKQSLIINGADEKVLKQFDMTFENTLCAMNSYTVYKNDFKSTKLVVALEEMGIEKNQSHRAMDDCKDTLDLINACNEKVIEKTKGTDNMNVFYEQSNNVVSDEQKELADKLMKGVCDVLNGKGSDYLKHLDTLSKMIGNKYSMNNQIAIFNQFIARKLEAEKIDLKDISNEQLSMKIEEYMKGDDVPSLCMGYEAWKDYGRTVTGKGVHYSIYTPVKAYERNKGDLFNSVLKNANSEGYRLGKSNLHFVRKENGNIDVKINNQKLLYSFEKMQLLKEWLEKNVIGEVIVGYDIRYTYDIKNTTEPEYLYISPSKAKSSELALDEKGNKILYKGQVKIKNTEERKNKLKLDYKSLGVEPKDEKSMQELFKTLVLVANRQNPSVFVEVGDTKDPKVGGYFNRAENKIMISETKNITERVVTLLHEISHSRLHKDLEKMSNDIKEIEGEELNISRNLLEVQAESMCYLTAGKLGIDTSGRSFEYIVGWNEKYDLAKIEKSMKLMLNESDKLLKDINKVLSEKKEVEVNAEYEVEAKEENAEFIKAGKEVFLNNISDKIDIDKELNQTLNDGEYTSDDVKKLLIKQKSNVVSQIVNYYKLDNKLNQLEQSDNKNHNADLRNSIMANMRKSEYYNEVFDNNSKDFVGLMIDDNNKNIDNFKNNRMEFLKEHIKSNREAFKDVKISEEALKYISTSKYLYSSNKLDVIKNNDVSAYISAGLERISEITNANKNLKVFVEVSDIENLSGYISPIKQGDILTPYEAEEVTKGIEKTIGESAYAGLRTEFSVFTKSKDGLSCVNFKYDIGDNGQASISEVYKNIIDKHTEIDEKIKNLSKEWNSSLLVKSDKIFVTDKIYNGSVISAVNKDFDLKKVQGSLDTYNNQEVEVENNNDNIPNSATDNRKQDEIEIE